MAHFLALLAGLLMLASAQASDTADLSTQQGFLSKYMPLESVASKNSLGEYDKFMAHRFNHMKQGGGSEALSHHNGPAEHEMARDEFQQAGQKLFSNDSNLLVGAVSAIAGSLLTLVAMLGYRLRRGTQPTAALASSGAHVELLENAGSTSRVENFRIPGWGQHASQSSRASTACYAAQSDHWMDHLKFGGATPSFDVIEQTKKYIEATAQSQEQGAIDYHAKDYVFRGTIVGPITGKDVRETQKGFNLLGAFPDIDRGIFGYQIDPQNPFRCLFFERWTGTMTGDVKIGNLVNLPATQKRVELPVHVSSIVWNPDGKIAYETVSPPIDRFEGNVKGAGAVFGLLAGAGLSLPASVGDPVLMAQQRLNTDILKGIFGKTWSSESEIPSWWKSKAKGADPNDI